jgi:HEAT repeat protein
MMKAVKIILILLAIVTFLIPQHAAEVLGQAKESGEVERLINDLKDESWQIRWYAAQALGDMNDPHAVEPLIAVLKNDKHVYVLATTAWALGELKDRRAVKPLIDAMGHEVRDVRRNAAWALKKITGKDFGEDPAKWQEWWQAQK